MNDQATREVKLSDSILYVLFCHSFIDCCLLQAILINAQWLSHNIVVKGMLVPPGNEVLK